MLILKNIYITNNIVDFLCKMLYHYKVTSCKDKIFHNKGIERRYFMTEQQSKILKHFEELVKREDYREFSIKTTIFPDDSVEIIFTRLGEQNAVENKKVENKKIDDLLSQIGICKGVKGYVYIKEAINVYLENEQPQNLCIMDVYDLIAKKCSTTRSNVERCIRHAIESAHQSGDGENNQVVEYLGCKTTNKVFLMSLANYIKIN